MRSKSVDDLKIKLIVCFIRTVGKLENYERLKLLVFSSSKLNPYPSYPTPPWILNKQQQKLLKNINTGLHFSLPCVETHEVVDMRTITLGVPPQEVLLCLCVPLRCALLAALAHCTCLCVLSASNTNW